MNERIEEFYSQVGLDFENFQRVTVKKGDMEKFALLIVRECADRCEDIAFAHQYEDTTYAAGKKAGAFECSADLKQHFGVEE